MQIKFLIMSLATLASLPSSAAPNDLALLTINGVDGSQTISTKLEILITMTLLGFIPSIVIMCTSFTRIVIVLSILRQALGLQQSPSNHILAGIALIFTAMIMRPVWTEMLEVAYQPYQSGKLSAYQAIVAAKAPLNEFMINQTDLNTYEKVLDIAAMDNSTDINAAPFSVVLPAFLLSELKAAFQIGFMYFLPFLAIDIIVASVLMSMGMMMLSPLIVSLPFKLMLFVALDGWGLIVSSLASSFWV